MEFSRCCRGAVFLCSVPALTACAASRTATSLVASPPPQTDARGDPGANRWRFEIEPYVWLPSTSGTGTTDTTPPLEIDLVGTLDAAFPLAVGARSPDGRLTVLADGFYVRLKDDEGSLRTTTEAAMVEGGVGVALDEENQWSVLLGLRYVDVDYDVSVGTLTGSAGADWYDPWVGARAHLPFDETWAIRLRGDVGGFGVGTEFSWQAIALLAVAVGTQVAIDVGYRAIGIDYEGSGLDYEVVFHGPIVGLAVSF